MSEEKRVETTVNTERIDDDDLGERIKVERTREFYDTPDDRDINIHNRGLEGIRKRVSWGAIFAGVVIALVIQLALSILGLAIGASTIDPVTEANPVQGLAMGTAIWFVVTVLISLFAGGWVAGRLAGIPRVVDSALHGILTWGFATLLLFYFLTSTVGSIIGGTFGILGSGISAATSGVVAVAPEVAGMAQDQMEKRGIDFDITTLRQEIEKTLKQTDKAALQPEAIKDKAENIADEARQEANEAANDPTTSDEAVGGLLERIQKRGSATIDAADREALVNVIMARTGKSREEAQATVASYDQTYQQIWKQYEETRNQAAVQAREIGQSAAEGVSSTATWAFIALLLSAIAAAVGGLIAAPEAMTVENTETRTV